ncbi:hypothetical protein FDUTEX481_03471 [Tolypothrix sp. PCC 7601]|nr:hypothetical protein FDUTEX481_03471 [Tolypothrix sp. PCC 7601]
MPLVAATFTLPLVVHQPKIAMWRWAGEQGSKGAEEKLVVSLSPLPLCPSAPLLTTTQSWLGRLLVRHKNTPLLVLYLAIPKSDLL